VAIRHLSGRKSAPGLAFLIVLLLILSGCSGRTTVEPEEQPGERYQVQVALDPPTLNIPHLGTLTFQVIDTANGNKPVEEFAEVSGALLHHINVSHDLEYFYHSFTEVLVDKQASVFVNFPKLGSYYSYALFRPAGAELQTYRQTITAGPADEHPPDIVPDASPRKQAGWLTFDLITESEIKRGSPTQLVLHVSERGQEVTALSPYLNAPGHLWLIDSEGEHPAHIAGAAEGRRVAPTGTTVVGGAGGTETAGTSTPSARGTSAAGTPQAIGTAEGEDVGQGAGSTTGGTGAASAGQGGTRSGGPGTPPVEQEMLPIERPTYVSAIEDALATVTAGPRPTFAAVQQTAQSYIQSTPETGSDYAFGPDVAFTHTFPEAGLYKLWFEVLHRGQVVLVSYVVDVSD